MSEFIELLTEWQHWAFEIVSGGVFVLVGLAIPERFNFVKRLVARHDKEHHTETHPADVSHCICIRFNDTDGFRIADLMCPIHGVEGVEPGDGYWSG